MLRAPRLNPRLDYSKMSQEELVERYLAGYRRYEQLAASSRHLLNEYDHADDREREALRAEWLKAHAAATAQMDAYMAIFPYLTKDTVDKYLRVLGRVSRYRS